MLSTRNRVLTIGLLAAVVALATVTVAYAAPPTIPRGAGIPNGQHSTYPGYCLNCHPGFAVSPPTITAGATAPHAFRGSTCTQCHVVKPAVVPPPTGPKPTIKGAKFTNPLAYDIASLVRTRFLASVDVTGAVVELTVSTPAGVKTVYKGKINQANSAWLSPYWNGMGINGKRLVSASYPWTFKATTTGGTTTVTGKLTISSIFFTFKGSSVAGAKKVNNGYMKPGPANVYIGALSSMPSDRYTLGASRGTAYRVALGAWNVGPTTPCKATSYMRGVNAVKSPGLVSFTSVGKTAVNYTVTVIQ